MIILETKNLYKSYKDKEILKDINLEFKSGKIYSLIGPNGSGKTTLIKLLSGNLMPTSGEIFLYNTDIKKLTVTEIAKKIAVLNQTNINNIDFTVSQIVKYGRNPYKKLFQNIDNTDEKIINSALEKTDLISYKNKKLNELSGGERQRAWLAMALAQTPKILILDEPTTYLDISHQINILDLISKLNKNEKLTVIMVLHDINHALKYSDEIIVLKDKKILSQGLPEEILESKVLDKAFGVESIVLKDVRLDEAIFYPTGFKINKQK